MYRYIRSSSYEYKGYPIYYDKDSGNYHIFIEPMGKGRMDFESDKAAEEYIDDIYDSSKITCSDDELKTYDVYFDGRCYGQVKARSEDEAEDQAYEINSPIPSDLFVGVDKRDLPDLIWVEKAEEDDIEECDSVESAIDPKKSKKYILTYRISQVWYENGEEVDRDTWEETRTTRRADNEIIAQAIVETKLEREYGCKTGEWELELECINIKEG